MEIQQSALYAAYIRSLKWNVEKIDGAYVYYRYFPVMGGIAKIQRPTHLPDTKKLIPFLIKQKTKILAFEPEEKFDQRDVSRWTKIMAKHFLINKSPYLPTKTIRVDLKGTEEEIFKKFSEAKRRGVRRALKNNLSISVTSEIRDMIKIKNKSAGLFGSITTYGVDKMGPLFFPDHGKVILAAKPNKKVVAGVLILVWEKMAYYWIAGATREGKKLFAPTLLVWEALKEAKKMGATKLDFLGVWDERMPQENREWLGFTKFKEGFGGNEFYFPLTKF